MVVELAGGEPVDTLIQALTESRGILGPAGYLGSYYAKYTQEMNNSKYSILRIGINNIRDLY